MKTIKLADEIYAILVEREDATSGTNWIGDRIESLQGSVMNYPKGRFFKVHHHIMNPRTIKRTQESFIVISGRIVVDVYDNNSTLLGSLYAGPGEAIFVYRGGHGVRVLEDFVGYEVKAGQFTFKSEDKTESNVC